MSNSSGSAPGSLPGSAGPGPGSCTALGGDQNLRMRKYGRFGSVNSVYCGVLLAVVNCGIPTAVPKDDRRCDLFQTVWWWHGCHRHISGANLTHFLQHMERQGRHVAATLHVGTYQHGNVGLVTWTLHHANVTLTSTSPPSGCCFVTRSRLGSACVPCGGMRHYVTQNNLSQLHLAAFWLRSSASSADTEQHGPGRERTRLVSDIVSVSMSDVHPTDLNTPLELLLRHTAPVWSPGRVQCVFWEVQSHGWSSRGCRTVWSNASHSQCRCRHLTSFAVIFNIFPTQDTPTDADDVNRRAQSVLTSVVLPLSIAGFVLAIVTIRMLPATDSVSFRLHLMVCIMLSQIVFLSGVEATDHRQTCVLVAVTLHYLLLCAYQWMFLLAVQLGFLLFLPIFTRRKRCLSKKHYLLVCIFAYGSPMLVVVVALSSRFQHYTACNYCWLNPRYGVIYSFLVPVYVISSFNYVVFVGSLYVMHTHYRTRDWSRTKCMLKWVKGFFTLIDNLGVICFFGHLSAFSDIFAYAFVVFGGLYGVFFFVFHCVMMKKVRSIYLTWALCLTERCPRLFPRCISEYIRKREVLLRMQRSGRGSSLVEVLAAAAVQAVTDQSAPAPGTHRKLGWFQAAVLNKFGQDWLDNVHSESGLNVEGMSSAQPHNCKTSVQNEDGNLSIGQILSRSVSSTMTTVFGEDSLSSTLDQVEWPSHKMCHDSPVDEMPPAAASLFRSMMFLGNSPQRPKEKKMVPRMPLKQHINLKVTWLGRLTSKLKRKLPREPNVFRRFPRRRGRVTKTASGASHVSTPEPIEIVTSTLVDVAPEHPVTDLDRLQRKLNDIDPMSMNQQKVLDLDPKTGSDSMDLCDTEPLPVPWDSATLYNFDDDNVMLTDDSAVKYKVTSAKSDIEDSLSLSGTWSPMELVLEAAKSASTEDSDLLYDDTSIPKYAPHQKNLYASAVAPVVPVGAQPRMSPLQRISVGAQKVFRKISLRELRHHDASAIQDSSAKAEPTGKIASLRNSIYRVFSTPSRTARWLKSSHKSVRARRLAYPQALSRLINLRRRKLTWGTRGEESGAGGATVDKSKPQEANISMPGTSCPRLSHQECPAIPTITLTNPDNVTNIVFCLGDETEEWDGGSRSQHPTGVTKQGRAKKNKNQKNNFLSL